MVVTGAIDAYFTHQVSEAMCRRKSRSTLVEVMTITSKMLAYDH